MDSRIWPRNAAIAERFWSPEATTDVASMYARLDTEAQRLEWLGLTHRSFQRTMLQRIAGPASASEFDALHSLAQALEHQKEYTREDSITVQQTSLSPLNRLVDAVFPESDVSHRFSLLVDQFAASACKDATLEAQIRAQLVEWATLEDRMRSLTLRSHLAKDARPAAAALSQAAKVALGALDAVQKGSALSEDEKKKQLAALQALEKQTNQSQLTLPELPAFQKLVEAAAVGGSCATAK